MNFTLKMVSFAALTLISTISSAATAVAWVDGAGAETYRISFNAADESSARQDALNVCNTFLADGIKNRSNWVKKDSKCKVVDSIDTDSWVAYIFSKQKAIDVIINGKSKEDAINRVIAACEKYKSAGDECLTSTIDVRYSQYIKTEPQPQQKKPDQLTTYSGTGFVINKTGEIVTNHHVVSKCRKFFYSFSGNPNLLAATIRAYDPVNDLAVLSTGRTFSSYASLRFNDIRTGERISSAGFPLQQYLSNQLIFNTGVISALAGANNDYRFIQESAPIQPGNSGGPLFDKHGNVIGITTQHLNDSVASETHSNPQNVNFAIKSDILRTILASNDIDFNQGKNSSIIDDTDLVDKAKNYVVKIICN